MKFNVDCTINTVADCLNKIKVFKKNRHLNNCTFFYRGEANDYKSYSLESKLFRPIINDKHVTEYGNLTLYKKGSQEFYRRLNTFNRKIDSDFMAYCQHHGFPTPLLDITTSVLVGLYFACCDDNCINKPGYLYIFNKDDFLQYPSDYLKHDHNNLDPYLNLRNLVFVIRNYEWTSDAFNDHFKIHWTQMRKNLIKEFHKYYEIQKKQNKIYTKSFKILYKIKSLSELGNILRYDILNNDDSSLKHVLSKKYIQFLKAIKYIHDDSILRKSSEYPSYYFNFTDEALLYVFYIYISRHNRKFNLFKKGFIPSDLVFYVRTHYDWDRVKAQNGYFILEVPYNQYSNLSLIKYNDFKNHYSTINKPGKRFIHNVKPSYVIRINNKKNIIKELHDFGINDASLFNDVDHLAHYVQNKYIYKINLF